MCAVIQNMSVCHDVSVRGGQFAEDRQQCAAAACWAPVYLFPGIINCFIVHHRAICFEIGGKAVAVEAGHVNQVLVNANRREPTAAYALATITENAVGKRRRTAGFVLGQNWSNLVQDLWFVSLDKG